MYKILVLIQLIGLVVAFVELAYVLYQKPSRQQLLLVIITTSCLINSIGYLFELTATTFDTALMGVKFAYIGKVYILLAMFLFILNYCKVDHPIFVSRGLFFFHSFIALLVLTCSYHHLFYKDITFEESGLFPHLVTSPGIFYYIFMSLMVIYFVTMPIVCIKRYRSIDDLGERKQIVYLLVMASLPMFGFIFYQMGKTQNYDTTALSYVISIIILLFSIFRHNLFDTLEAAKDNVIDNLENGILVFDTANTLLYSNVPAKKLCPQIEFAKDKDELIAAVADLDQWADEASIRMHEERAYTVVRRTIHFKHLIRGHMYLFTDVTDSYFYTQTLEREVKEQTAEIEKIQHAVITSFAGLIEARDDVTGQHVKRTSATVDILTHALKKKGYYRDYLTDQVVDYIVNAAPLHDVGKIAIPDAILQKPGKLTPEEFEIIKTHSAYGAEIIDEMLQEVNDAHLVMAKDMAHYHHEKWDGSGYPCGLKGREIPLCARIMAIADVYDALTSKRTYKEAFSKEKALSIIEEGRGTHFDPVLVDIFIECFDQIKEIS